MDEIQQAVNEYMKSTPIYFDKIKSDYIKRNRVKLVSNDGEAYILAVSNSKLCLKKLMIK